jgi:hypothetical protein
LEKYLKNKWLDMPYPLILLIVIYFFSL